MLLLATCHEKVESPLLLLMSVTMSVMRVATVVPVFVPAPDDAQVRVALMLLPQT